MAKPKRGRSTATIDDHVGSRIRERRIMLGLTQQQLADLIGVTYQQAHKYERGINRISAGRLYEIAQELSVQVGYFFDGLQGDASYKLLSDHTLRGGFLITGERVASKLDAQVLVQDGTDAAGNPTFGSTPATSFPTEIVDGTITARGHGLGLSWDEAAVAKYLA